MSSDQLVDKEKLAKNSIFSVLAWLSPIALGFITTPILVIYLGHEQYGLLAIIYGFLSYSFTFSIGKVAAKFIPEYRATGKESKISQLISATIWFSLLIAIIGSLGIALFARYIVSDILMLPEEMRDNAVLALYIACIAGLLMMVSQVFQYTLQGLHKFGSYLLLTNIGVLTLGVGNIVLALNGFGIIALLNWNLITVFFTAVLYLIRSKQSLDGFTLTTNIESSVISSVWRYGSSIILFQVFSNVLYIFERAWVTRKFGPEGLTFYAVPMLLAIYIHSVIGSFVQALFPHINELLENKQKLVKLYQKATKIVIALTVFICTAYVIAGKQFLSLWLASDFAEKSFSLLVIHSLTFTLLAIIIIPLQIAEAFKFSSLTAIITCVWMITAIFLMLFITDTWQMEGVAASRLALIGIITFPLIFFVERKFLGGIFWSFWTKSLFRITISAAVTFAIGYFFFHTFSQNWLSLITGILICGSVYGVILLMTGYLSREERILIRNLLTNRGKILLEEKF